MTSVFDEMDALHGVHVGRAGGRREAVGRGDGDRAHDRRIAARTAIADAHQRDGHGDDDRRRDGSGDHRREVARKRRPQHRPHLTHEGCGQDDRARDDPRSQVRDHPARTC